MYQKKYKVYSTITAVMLSIVMLFSLAGCSTDENDKNNSTENGMNEAIESMVSKYEGFSELEENPVDIIISEDNTEQTDLSGKLDQETQNNNEPDDNIKPKSHPDSYYVTWLVPGEFTEFDDDRMSKINLKLEEDGYEFGIKLLRYYQSTKHDEEEDSYKQVYAYYSGNRRLETEDVSQVINNSGADIVYTGVRLEGSYIEDDMKAGIFVDLTEYIENGTYFKYLPQIQLDSMKYNGRIYAVSSLMLQDGGKIQLINRDMDQYNVDFASNPLNIFKYLSEDNKLYYGLDTLDFVELFGYSFDSIHGTVVDQNGKLINPFEDKRCVEWMREVNKAYKEDKLQFYYSDSCGFRLHMCGPGCVPEDPNAEYTLKIGMIKKPLGTTAILSTSEKKDEAFELMELFRKNPDYGNLLIYGYTVDGEGEKPKSAFNRKAVLGLDDGLLYAEPGTKTDMNHFMTLEERNKFYEENVVASPSLYIDFPTESYKLRSIIDNYLFFKNNILKKDNFEERFASLKKEYGEVYKRVKKLMS